MWWKSILLFFSVTRHNSRLADIMTLWHCSEEFHLSNEPWKPRNLKIQPCCHLIPHTELTLKPLSVKTIKLPLSSPSSIIYSCISRCPSGVPHVPSGGKSWLPFHHRGWQFPRSRGSAHWLSAAPQRESRPIWEFQCGASLHIRLFHELWGL